MKLKSWLKKIQIFDISLKYVFAGEIVLHIIQKKGFYKIANHKKPNKILRYHDEKINQLFAGRSTVYCAFNYNRIYYLLGFYVHGWFVPRFNL